MFIPADSIFIQNYLTIIKAGLLNTRVAMIITQIGTGMGVFLMVQNFKTLPKELIEAARVDGAGWFRIYYTIVLPLSKNVLASWGMFSFLSLWNMYLWPLMVTTKNDSRTVQIGLKMLTSDEANQWGVIMAAVVLVVAPSLILLFTGQKYIQKNLVSGAVKG
jgi:sn-glycerol 3-phosphate transport system permease protein